jgi:hypothetical protein
LQKEEQRSIDAHLSLKVSHSISIHEEGDVDLKLWCVPHQYCRFLAHLY